MAAVAMGRFAFYAHSMALSNIFKFGSLFGSNSNDGSSTSGAIPNDPPVTTPSVLVDESQKTPSPKDLDLINDLPGLDFDPGFDQYSGYLTIDEAEQRKIFYWYVESQGDPATDPLIFWTNGGPGCSGLLGLGTEHGPFYFSADGVLSPNPFSWNKLANIVYVEIPVGVGFSYSKHKKNYTTGDKQTAADNYKVIQQFLQRFPERQANDFYIASESYGGHYMPQLTFEILRQNTDGAINFKGMMVGNPYVDPYTTTIAQFQAWYGHGLLPWPLYKQYVDNCEDPSKYHNGECLSYMYQMYNELGKGINYYALDYPLCLEKDNNKRQSQQVGATGSVTQHGKAHNLRQLLLGASQQSAQLLNQTAKTVFESMQKTDNNNNPPFLPAGDQFRVCADNHFTRYLRRDDVVSAIHAHKGLPAWSECSDRVFLTYSEKDSGTSQVDLFRELIDSIQKDTALHILVYSGDDDSICSLACTQNWIWNLGVRAKHSSYWEPWFVLNQTAGFVTKFHLKHSSPQDSSFTFVTVRGAGHEVPLYRPMEAFEMLQRYLNHQW